MDSFPDFFFCTAPQSEERYERAKVTLSRWRNSLPVGKLHVMQAEHGKAYEFQKMRRVWAEERATTPIYIVADDDMEPSRIMCPRCWVQDAIEVMEKYPSFALLSPLLEATNFSQWTPEGYQPFQDENVWEFHNTGGIRFTRKGRMLEWPAQERRGYDQEQCDAYRAAGYRSGYFKNIWALHPGYKSETWKPVTEYVAPRLDIVC